MIPYKDILSYKEVLYANNSGGVFNDQLIIESKTKDFNLVGFLFSLSLNSVQEIPQNIERGFISVTFLDSKSLTVKKYIFCINTPATPLVDLRFLDFETFNYKDISEIRVTFEGESDNEQPIGTTATILSELYYIPLRY